MYRTILPKGENIVVNTKRPCYKYCIVPLCKNTNKRTPEKVFFAVPQNEQKRNEWCEAMSRDNVSSSLYCCEDHFDLEEDTRNYVQYNIMKQEGKKVSLRLKQGVVPHKFHCQRGKVPSAFKKMHTSRRTELINASGSKIVSEVQEDCSRKPIGSDASDSCTAVVEREKLQLEYENISSKRLLKDCEIKKDENLAIQSRWEILKVKEEISEQFVDEDKIQDMENVKVKEENPFVSSISSKESLEDFKINIYEQKIVEVKQEKSEQFVHEDETHEKQNVAVKEFVDLEHDKISSGELLENCEIKNEDMDISEQTEDENQIYEWEISKVKEESVDGGEIYDLENEEMQEENPPVSSGVANDSIRAVLESKISAVGSNIRGHHCGHCDYSSSFKPQVLKHIKAVHLKSKSDKSAVGEHIASTEQNLQNHIKVVRLKLQKYKCDQCDYASSRKLYLRNHIFSAHLGLKRHNCGYCDYATNWKQDLRIHIDSLHLNLEKPKQCAFCDFASSKNGHLKRHIESVHLDLRKHQCHLCDYSSSTKFCLQNHVNSVHFNLKKNQCQSCDFSTNRSENLRNHVNSVHLKLKKWECDS